MYNIVLIAITNITRISAANKKGVKVINSKAFIINFFFIIKEPDVLFCPQAMELIQVPEN